jgi:MipA family protein
MKSHCITLLGCTLLSWHPVHAAESAPDRLLIIGAGVGVMPEYEGGSKSRTGLIPFIQARRGRLSFDDGLRFDVVQSETTSLSVGASYDDGRRDYRPRWAGTMGSDHLHGMGRIERSATLDMRASQTLGAWELNADVTRWLNQPFTSAELGARLDLSGATGFNLSVGAYVDWNNRQYMQAHFGVSEEQSRRSGFAIHTSPAGVRSARLVAQAAWPITLRWMLVGTVSGDRLLDSAAHSPIVQQRNRLTASLIAAYRFY